MPIKESTREKKVRRIIDEGKPGNITIDGVRYHVSKKLIKEIKEHEKNGGVFPLIPIFAGIAAAGSVAGGASAIATSVNNKKFQDAQLEHLKAKDREVLRLLRGEGLFLPEYQKGNGFSHGIKTFAKESGLTDAAGKLLRSTLKPLSDKLNVIVKGKGLILVPK